MINEYYWCPYCKKIRKTGPNNMCNKCTIEASKRICFKCGYKKVILESSKMCDICTIISNRRKCSWCKLKRTLVKKKKICGLCNIACKANKCRNCRKEFSYGPIICEKCVNYMRKQKERKELYDAYDYDYGSTESLDSMIEEQHIIQNLLDYRYDYNLIKKASRMRDEKMKFQKLFKSIKNGTSKDVQQRLSDIVGEDIPFDLQHLDNIKTEPIHQCENSITTNDEPIPNKIKPKVNIDLVNIDLVNSDSDVLEYWQ